MSVVSRLLPCARVTSMLLLLLGGCSRADFEPEAAMLDDGNQGGGGSPGGSTTGGSGSQTSNGTGGSQAGTTGGQTTGGTNSGGSTGIGVNPEIDGGQLEPLTCDAPVACAQVTDMMSLGQVEWSQETLVKSVDGVGSKWFQVLVTGDMATNFVRGGIEARLTSPAGTNYDVFTYGGATGTDQGKDKCEGPQAKSEQPAGAVDNAIQTWAAGAFGLLTDRTVTIEVRHIDGPCAPWKLDVLGKRE